MIIAIGKELKNNENRVAITPEIVKKLIGAGFTIRVEKDAGLKSGFSNSDYKEAGAEVKNTAKTLYKDADIIFKINVLEKELEEFIKKDAVIISHMNALNDKKRVAELSKKFNYFAMELMPRISRAQSMDILSSMSNLAGYKAVVEAVSHLEKAVPMMMTAAGTVAPARALILGAGVAGLQAIATAKRLGAIVYASDVRPQVKEQIESLGARFVEVESDETGETEGGYAKEMSKEYLAKQSMAVHENLKKADIAICTALIPGKSAPKLISKQMLKDMPNGAVVIDMACETGGNCFGSKLNEIVEVEGVKVIGFNDYPSKLAKDASKLFSKNIYNFVSPFIKDGKIEFDMEDELVKGTMISQNGKIIHALFEGEK